MPANDRPGPDPLGESRAIQGLPAWTGLLIPGVGACCIPDGTCEIEYAEECSEIGGEYQGDDTICGIYACRVSGACCTLLGSCEIRTAAECSQISGTYQGDNTSCDNAPCVATGACCFANQCAEDAPGEACILLGGVFLGGGTVCAAGVCDVEVGACCVAGQVCYETFTLAMCNAVGGSWGGPDSPCTANCISTGGACCLDLANASFCVFTAEASCTGTFLGVGTTCSATVCPGLGACCVSGLACLEMLPSMCIGSGAVFMGTGVPCSSVMCDIVVVGACCREGSICDAGVTAGACVLGGGTFLGNGSTCDGAPCSGPLGACCSIADGSCARTTAAGCAAAGGIYYGDATTCASVTCAEAGACCFGDICVPGTSASDCASAGGRFLGVDSACDAGACEAPSGACRFVIVGYVCIEDTTEAVCIAYYGVWQGAGSLCSDGGGVPATGACCSASPGGQCLVTTEEACVDVVFGTYLGHGTFCSSNSCSVVGACCLGADCYELSPNGCGLIGGTYQGDIACLPGICGPVTGACCKPLAGCATNVTQIDCDYAGGLWLGAGTDCVGSPCNGACCYPDGCQDDQTDVACLSGDGQFFGVGTQCAGLPCQLGACCAGPVCSIYTSAGCSLVGGYYLGDGTDCGVGSCADCNNNGIPDSIDIAGGASADCNGNGVPDECESAGPFIGQQPLGQAVHVGEMLTLSVTLDPPDPNATYQWRRDGWALVDNPAVSGATSSILRLDPAQMIDNAAFDVLITTPCGSVTSVQAPCSVLSLPSGPWDLTTGFGYQLNPTGPWSFGHMLWSAPPVSPDAFVPFDEALSEPPVARGWAHAASGANLWKNLSNGYGCCNVPPNKVTLHPGRDGVATVARWSAPFGVDGLVRISGQFMPGDGATENCHVLKNGESLFSAVVAGTAQSFLIDVALSLGDRIDFVVEGAYFYGNTPLEARVELLYETGACCNAIGFCVESSLSYCDDLGGSFQGVGSVCSQATCPTAGACCYGGYCDSSPSFFECLLAGGVFIGAGSPCEPAVCDTPAGGCCAPDGSFCYELFTQPVCAAIEGVWAGAGVGCITSACVSGGGACCIGVFGGTGLCAVTTESICTSGLGTFLGVGSSCAGLLCPDTGACCTFGSCAIARESDCISGGGRFIGAGTPCLPDICADSGACCSPSGVCSILTPAACGQLGGIYQGAVTDCDPNPCGPVGACCSSAVLFGAQPATNRILKISPIDGSILGSFAPPAAATMLPGHVRIGLAYGNGVLYYVNTHANPDTIYELDPTNGTQVRATRLTASAGDDSHGDRDIDGGSFQFAGLAFGAGKLFADHAGVDLHRIDLAGANTYYWGDAIVPARAVGGDNTARIFALDTSNVVRELSPVSIDAITNSFASPVTGVEGLAFNGEELFASTTAGGVYRLDPDTGSVRGQFAVAGGALYGLAVAGVLADCSVMTEAACVQGGGSWHGPDTTCADLDQDGAADICESPSGACCLSGNACQVITASECASQSGAYRGDGTTCEPNPCLPPPPTGACCVASGACSPDQTQSACTTVGGSWQGANTLCTPDPCPPPPGACCFPTGFCTSTADAAACAAQGGTFQGAGSLCSGVTCPVDPCALDTDGDGSNNCVDGCPDDPAKTSPGVCGCGVSDLDGEGDGVADCVDNCPTVANADQADLDNDGVGSACDSDEPGRPEPNIPPSDFVRGVVDLLSGRGGGSDFNQNLSDLATTVDGVPGNRLAELGNSGREVPDPNAAAATREIEELAIGLGLCPVATIMIVTSALAGARLIRRRH